MLISSVTQPVENVVCNICMTEFKDELEASVRKPCPVCGALTRQYNRTLECQSSARVNIAIKGRRSGSRKPFIEIMIGEDLSRMLNRWMYKERVIDHENNHYKEIVTDPDSKTIIHLCEEPLDQHQGHGSAKI